MHYFTRYKEKVDKLLQSLRGRESSFYFYISKSSNQSMAARIETADSLGYVTEARVDGDQIKFCFVRKLPPISL